jgi:hypothetical protein
MVGSGWRPAVELDSNDRQLLLAALRALAREIEQFGTGSVASERLLRRCADLSRRLRDGHA